MTKIEPDATVKADGTVEYREDSPLNPDARTIVAEDGIYTAGVWAWPLGSLYPPVTLRRGGIAFTAPPQLQPPTKTQLRARVVHLEKALRIANKRRYKAERKVARLLKIIRRIA